MSPQLSVMQTKGSKFKEANQEAQQGQQSANANDEGRWGQDGGRSSRGGRSVRKRGLETKCQHLHSCMCNKGKNSNAKVEHKKGNNKHMSRNQ